MELSLSVNYAALYRLRSFTYEESCIFLALFIVCRRGAQGWHGSCAANEERKPEKEICATSPYEERSKGAHGAEAYITANLAKISPKTNNYSRRAHSWSAT